MKKTEVGQNPADPYQNFDANQLHRLPPVDLAILAKKLAALDTLGQLDSSGQITFGLVLMAQLKAHIHDDDGPQPALEPKDKRCSRMTFQTIANAEFFNEVAYGFFQYKVTYNGLMQISLPAYVASVLTGLLALADFLNNITNFSPANDANSWLFTTRPPLKSSTLRWLASIINTISIIGSYIPGSTPGYAEMLLLLPSSWPSQYFILAAVLMGVIAVLPGTAYFIGFHDDSMHKTFQALEQWRACKHKDCSWLRSLETFKKITGIISYRALCFAFFMQNCLYALKMTDGAYRPLILTLSALTFIATALNVLFARLLPTIAETMHSQFVHVTPQEFQRATEHYLGHIFSHSGATANHISTLSANVLIASGYGLMTYASMDHVTKYLAAITIAMVLATISMGAQREAAIYQYALANIDTDDLNHRMTMNTPHPPIDPEDSDQTLLLDPDDSLEDRLKITRANFTWLANTFKSRELFIGAAILSTLARLARMFGFYYFACQLNLVFNLQLSQTMLIGLCLAFAPDNIKNEWLIFTNGTVDTLAQKIAEAFVAYSAATTEYTFIGWSLMHFWSIFNKAFLAYDLKAEVWPAMQLRIDKLIPSASASNALAAFNREPSHFQDTRLLISIPTDCVTVIDTI